MTQKTLFNSHKWPFSFQSRGYLFWGIFPIKPEISWESHLWGGVAGFGIALLYGKTVKPYPPEPEQEEDDDEEEEEKNETDSGTN